MKLSELLQGIKIESARCDMSREITGLCTDSRSAKPGNLFFALAGVAVGSPHGHIYAKSASAAGAVVITEIEPSSDFTGEYLLVSSTRHVLAAAAANFYCHPEKQLRIIGVTGTKGKTTTTHLIKTVLEHRTGKAVGLIGTLHIMIGDTEYHSDNTTPEANVLMKYFRMMADAGCEFAVMEVSSHSLALSRVEGIQFETAAFLNLTHDHLDFHKTMDNYAQAKAKIFLQCRHAVINADADYVNVMLEAAPSAITFSAKRNDATLLAKNIRLMPDGAEFEAVTLGSIARIRIGLPGMFSVYNALAVVAVAMTLGMDLDEIADALRGAKGVRGRCEPVETGKNFGVIIDYAHTPDSLENILRTVRGFTKNRVIAVFGCGGNRDKTKRPLMGAAVAALSDYYIITSDNPRFEEPEDIIADILPGVQGSKTPHQVIADRRAAIAAALAMAYENDTVVVAGKGHEDYQEIKGVKHHFDDREVIEELLQGGKG